jgi:hypothetical protein
MEGRRGILMDGGEGFQIASCLIQKGDGRTFNRRKM